MPVLVAYATAHGSTRGIAERLAGRLREHGYDARCHRVEDVPDGDVAAYDAVLVGSAVHSSRWLPPAVEFTRRNAGTLAQRPVWLFSVSSLGERSSAFPEPVARRLRARRTEPKGLPDLRAAVQARGSHDFAGVLSPEDWGLAGRAFMTLMRGRYGDLRDWGEVDDWADDVAAALTTATAPGSG